VISGFKYHSNDAEVTVAAVAIIVVQSMQTWLFECGVASAKRGVVQFAELVRAGFR
jgi:hypothetical protein